MVDRKGKVISEKLNPFLSKCSNSNWGSADSIRVSQKS